MKTTTKTNAQRSLNGTKLLRQCLTVLVWLHGSSAFALGGLAAAGHSASGLFKPSAPSPGVEVHFTTLIPVDVETDEITQEDVQAYIPTHIPAGSDGSAVANKILNRSLKTLTKKFTEKNRGLAKATEKLQNLETNMTFGSSAQSADGSPSTSIEHKISFRLDAFETLAMVKYRGLVQADLSFDLARQDAALQIHRDLGGSMHLSLVQNLGRDENRSYLQLQFQY